MQMKRVMFVGFNFKIVDMIEYVKKLGKMQLVKVFKDVFIQVDFYKSGIVYIL